VLAFRADLVPVEDRAQVAAGVRDPACNGVLPPSLAFGVESGVPKTGTDGGLAGV